MKDSKELRELRAIRKLVEDIRLMLFGLFIVLVGVIIALFVFPLIGVVVVGYGLITMVSVFCDKSREIVEDDEEE